MRRADAAASKQLGRRRHTRSLAVLVALAAIAAPLGAHAQETREFPSQHGTLRVETLAAASNTPGPSKRYPMEG